VSLDAYDLARLDGFTGSRDDLIKARYLDGGMDAARAAGFRGTEKDVQDLIVGKQSGQTSPYDMAVLYGFRGTAKDWLASLHGSDGLSAYQLALVKGYQGSQDEWLESLKGQDGLDAYQLAITKGFKGSLDEFLDSLQGKNATPEQIYAAVTTFLTLNPPKDGADATPEMVAQAVDVWLSANPPAPGQKGDMPDHQWDGTRIRFEKPDGSWGEWVDLRGAGSAGSGGGGSLSIQKFYPTFADFPTTGKSQVLYFDQSTDPWGVYVWAGDEYQQVGGGSGGLRVEYYDTSIEFPDEGEENVLYVARAATSTADSETETADTEEITADAVGAQYLLYVWEAGSYHPIGGKSTETFETIAENLRAADEVRAFNEDGDLISVTYSDGIVKTLEYNGNGDQFRITLSGSTPAGIKLVKTRTFDANGNITEVKYT
jgi:hypothetical protein